MRKAGVLARRGCPATHAANVFVALSQSLVFHYHRIPGHTRVFLGSYRSLLHIATTKGSSELFVSDGAPPEQRRLGTELT